jgi:ELWxxDGT repeat protein
MTIRGLTQERVIAGGLAAAALLLAIAFSAVPASADTSVHRLADLNPGGASSSPADFTGVGGSTYFTAVGAGSGRELWWTDGNSATRVADIRPGPASSDPSELINLGGVLVFVADDGVHGRELWRYDGVNPPAMAADLSGLGGSNPGDLVNAAGTLFFHAQSDPATGDELWKYDGFNPPVMLAPMPGGIAFTGGSDPTDLTAVGGTVYFWANDSPMHATELWKSNGTDSGTVLVEDINTTFEPPPGSGFLGQERLPMAAVGGQLLFDANNDTDGIELWKYDGTNPPVEALAADGGINPGAGGSTPAGITDINGTAFFSANDGTNGIELWKSDPPYTGASLISDVNPGLNSYPEKFTPVNGSVFFSAQNGLDGTELWRTDGGSVSELLAGAGGIRPGFFGSSPNYLTAFGNMLLFEANDGTGFELWQSDGTTASRVAQINPNGGSYPNSLANVNGVVYFAADDGTAGSELWRTGPAAPGKKAKACKKKKAKGKAEAAAKNKKKKKKHCKKKKRKGKRRR